MSYSVGERVSGVVSGVTAFGAFVNLADGNTGMIHISKLSRDFVSDIHSVIKKGDEVTATVISVSDGKIALSLVGDSSKKVEHSDGYELRKPKKTQDFEAMLSSFKSASDEKLAGMSRSKNNDRRKRK